MKQAIVMEGYTDVMFAHQCGINNAVAVLGTALGPGTREDSSAPELRSGCLAA